MEYEGVVDYRDCLGADSALGHHLNHHLDLDMDFDLGFDLDFSLGFDLLLKHLHLPSFIHVYFTLFSFFFP